MALLSILGRLTGGDPNSTAVGPCAVLWSIAPGDVKNQVSRPHRPLCFSICCRPMFVSHLLEVIMTFPKFVACCKNHTHFTCNLTGALSPAQKTSTWSCAVCQAGGGGRDPLTPGLREMRSCCPGWGVEASFNAVRIPWNSPERLAWDPANNGNILSLGNDYPKFLMKSKGTCGTLCRTLRMAQIG